MSRRSRRTRHKHRAPKCARSECIEPNPNLLTDREAEILVRSFLVGRADNGFTEDEGDTLLSWVRRVRLNEGLIQNVLQGNLLVVDVEDGEPVFTLSETGKRLTGIEPNV